jgi:hypothetical protein
MREATQIRLHTSSPRAAPQHVRLGLRRAEVLRLDPEDLDQKGGNQRGLGKVRNSKMKLPITWLSTNRKNGSVQSRHSNMQIAGAGDVSRFRW